MTVFMFKKAYLFSGMIGMNITFNGHLSVRFNKATIRKTY